MLIHQPSQQLCQQCGRLPAYATALCPSCGARLALPWPGQRFGPDPTIPYPPVVLVPQPNWTPLLVELLLNVLGIFGVGWLMLKRTTVGLPLLIGSLVLWPVIALLSIFTLGLGLVCLGPLAIGAMVGNILLLQQAIKRRTC